VAASGRRAAGGTTGFVPWPVESCQMIGSTCDAMCLPRTLLVRFTEKGRDESPQVAPDGAQMAARGGQRAAGGGRRAAGFSRRYSQSGRLPYPQLWD
jgi:hypothetical protein